MKNKNYLYLASFILFSCIIILTSCKKDEDEDNNDPAPPTPCQWETAFFDDFNRANGPIGTNYDAQLGCLNPQGGADIFNNQLRFRGQQCWAIRYTQGVAGNAIRVSIKFTVVDSSNYNFALDVFSKDLGNNYMSQEGYFGGVSMTGLGIFKMMGIDYEEIANMPYQLVIGHSYKLEFTAVNNELTLKIEDLGQTNTATLEFLDSGTVPSGHVVSINGFNSVVDVNLFDDYRVEVCK